MPSEDGEGEAMVIECESCSTRFHLADGRIPAKGARVRCSNCHHRFHVKPPPKTPDTASDAGQNSLSGTAESVPPQTATSQAPAMPASEPVSHQVQESVSKPVSKRHSDPDLDNPEFLFDTPSPETTAPRKAKSAEPPSTAPSSPGSGPKTDFGTLPEFETDAPPLLHDDDEDNPAPVQAGPVTAPAFELERPLPGQGFEPSIPGVDQEASKAPTNPKPPARIDVDDDMPVLEVERGEAGQSDPAEPSAIDTSSDSPNFDDVLAKDLDDDDDDTMSAWDSLGAPSPPAPIAPVDPPKPVHTDNVIAAAHSAAAGSAPLVESDYDPAPRRKAHGIVQGLAIGLALVLAAGAVRAVAGRAGGGLPGPEVITGAGWRAADIEAFHAYDLSRRRILVVRGSLSASAAVPAPAVGALLLNRAGQPLESEVISVLRRLDRGELTPQALTDRLRPRLAEPIAESLPAAPSEIPDAPLPLAAEAPNPDRGAIDGFTLLIAEPPAEARRFEVGLASR